MSAGYTPAGRAPQAAPVILHGRRLLLARAGWVGVALVALAVFVASLPTYVAQRQAVCTGRACASFLLTPATAQALRQAGLSVHSYAVLTTAVASGFALVWVAVAAVIVWRRADGWFPLFVALMLVTLGTTLNAEQIPAHSAWHWPILAIQFLGSASLVAFFYLFPDGRFVPRWTRWLALVLVALLVPFFVVPTLAVTRGQSPLGFLVAVAVLATAAGAQLYRYRRVSGPAQRQQAKWLVLGLAVMVGGLFGEGALAVLFPTRVHPGSPAWLLLMWLQYVLFVFVPLSIGVALLRYRLWDVDVLINKVLVYSALTATLGALYLGSVVGLSALLRGLTGERSTVAIVISTLMAAALFQPLRRRIQADIDRRFYRRKYDAAQALAAFSARLRDEVELNAVTADLLAVVDETMQPAQVALWLREPEREPSTTPGQSAT